MVRLDKPAEVLVRELAPAVRRVDERGQCRLDGFAVEQLRDVVGEVVRRVADEGPVRDQLADDGGKRSRVSRRGYGCDEAVALKLVPPAGLDRDEPRRSADGTESVPVHA